MELNLFDTPSEEPGPDPLMDGGSGENQVYSVTQVTRRVRALLEGTIGDIWVEGEISNLRKQASGHQYFTLKDANSQLSCVLFRGHGRFLRTPLEEGMVVQAFGKRTHKVSNKPTRAVHLPVACGD